MRFETLSFGQHLKRSGETRTLIVVALTLAMMVWEILAGIIYGSMALLAVFASYMVIESVGRFIQPVDISFDGAILVAFIGLVVNGVSAWILGEEGHDHGHDHGHGHGHHNHDDHNRRAAYLHVLADALTSVLAIVALLAGKYAGWNWMDPMMGIIGAILVTRWSWYLLKDTSKVLLDEQHQDMEEAVKQAVEDNDAKVSDLHVWAIGPNIHAAIVSVVSHQPESPTVYKSRIQNQCQSLVHVTVEPLRCD